MSKDGQWADQERRREAHRRGDLKDVAKILDLKATDALQLITKLIT